jgi:hypothetical protein
VTASVVPLSSLVPLDGQRSLWFLREIRPGTAGHSIAVVLRFPDGLDICAMEYALDAVAAGNASLREDDASDLDDAQLTGRIEDAAREPFDLDRGPLLRVHLNHRATRETVALIVAHHRVADFGSIITLVRELEMPLSGRTGDTPLPELTDFVRHYSWVSGSRLPSPSNRAPSRMRGAGETWTL